jgi:tetratricopeptide (TPR) repeat protein
MARDTRAADPWLLLAKIQLAQRNTDQAEGAFLRAIELNPDLRMPYVLLAQLYVSTHKEKQALEHLNGLVARHPNDVAALMQIGMLQDEMKNFSAARGAYEKLLTVNPRFSPALNNLANLCSEHFAQLEKAYEYARRARELLPGDPFAADTLGWLLYRKGDYSHALSLFQEAAAKLPSEPEVQFHLGMTYYMLDDPQLALPALQRAVASVKEFPHKEEGTQRLALLAIDVKKADTAAVGKLEEQLRAIPSDPVALDLLDSFYERNGSLDQAVKAYERALRFNPNNARVMAQLAQLYDTYRHDPHKALELAKEAHSLAPDDPRIAHIAGRLAFQARNYQWAASLLQESARQLPDDADISYDLAWALYGNGQPSEAEAALRMACQAKAPFSRTSEANRFLAMVAAANTVAAASLAAPEAQQVLAADPNYVPALMVSAIAREQQGKDLEAAQFYERALRCYPLFAPAARNLAILYAGHLADDSKAYPLAIKAREAFPQDPVLARTLGILAYRRGDFAGSAQLLKETARKRDRDAELFYYLGLAQYRLRQSKETKTSLQGALALNLSPKFADEARRILAELK